MVLPAGGATQKLGEVAGHSDRVVVIERGDGVIDVEEFVRLVGDVAVEHPLANRHEEAPDEDVLLATGDFDVLRLFFAEGHFPFGVVDIEVKIRVAIEVACDGFVQREVFQAVEEGGVRIELEIAGGVSIQIVFPGEQVFGESVEVEGIGGACGVLLDRKSVV